VHSVIIGLILPGWREGMTHTPDVVKVLGVKRILPQWTVAAQPAMSCLLPAAGA
jgi:hypothetical protein